jgi:hypothetical protein
MFDPSVGAWLEEDSEGFGAGDTNLRRYLWNNAENFTDPTGLADEQEKPILDRIFQQDPAMGLFVRGSLQLGTGQIAEGINTLTGRDLKAAMDARAAAIRGAAAEAGRRAAEAAEQAMRAANEQVLAGITVSSVTFVGGTTITKSDKPAAEDLKSDHPDTPVIYPLGSDLTVNATFTLPEKDAQAAGNVDVYGVIKFGGKKIGDIKERNVEKKGTTYSLEKARSTLLFTAVRAYKPLEITWYVSPAATGFEFPPEKEVGTTKKRVYATFGQPAIAPGGANLLETFVALGCQAAAGESEPDKVFAKIWEEFKTKNVKRADGKTLLEYWGTWDPFDPKLGKAIGAPGAEKLVWLTDATCSSWCNFMLATLYAQGLVGDKGKLAGGLGEVKVVGVKPIENLTGAWLLIKQSQDNPGWKGSGVNFLPFGSVIPVGDGKHFTLDVSNKSKWVNAGGGYNWVGTPSATYERPAKGQPNLAQNNAFPPGMFPDHALLRIGDVYYDPSYGTMYGTPQRYSENQFLRDFQTKAMYGYATFTPGTGVRNPDKMTITTLDPNSALTIRLINEQ